VTTATLTVADLDLFAQGERARIEVEKRVMQQVAKARTAADTARAVGLLASESEDTALARSAGVTPEHEREVMQAVGDLIADVQVQNLSSAAMDQIDTSRMGDAARAQAREMLVQARHLKDSVMTKLTEGMAPDVLAAFRQREPALDSLTTAVRAAMAGTSTP
jgi:hypothetical protein